MAEWITKEVASALAMLPEDRRTAAGEYAQMVMGATTRLVYRLDAANRTRPLHHLSVVLRGLVVVDCTLGAMVNDPLTEPFSPEAEVAGYRRVANVAGSEPLVKNYCSKGGTPDTIIEAFEGLVGVHGNVCALPSDQLATSPYNECLYAARLSYRVGVLIPVVEQYRP